MGFPIEFDHVVHVHHSGVSGPASNEYFAMKKAVEECRNNIFSQINFTNFRQRIVDAEHSTGEGHVDVDEDSVKVSLKGSSDSSVDQEIEFQNNCKYLTSVEAKSANCATKTKQNWKGERSFKLDAEVTLQVVVRKM
mmetsp:Transcript_21162/g.61549  ORF Transcript_21162/g.61549 Transcript_21162/m.61549 type:complete len:137 (-) Transcript_21162:472-882(-)